MPDKPQPSKPVAVKKSHPASEVSVWEKGYCFVCPPSQPFKPYSALIGPANDLARRAEKAVERVMVLEGVDDEKSRLVRIEEATAKQSEAEPPPILPIPMDMPPVNATSEVALNKRHADQVLSHASYVSRQHALLEVVVSGAQLGGDPPLLFSRMSSSLIEAERHLAALSMVMPEPHDFEIQRATKGGHAKNNPPSQKDQEVVMVSLIKAMLFNLSFGEKIHWPTAYKVYGKRIADNICWLNHSLKMFTCYPNDQHIRDAVEIVFYEKLKKLKVVDERVGSGGRVGRMRHALQFGGRWCTAPSTQIPEWQGLSVETLGRIQHAEERLAKDILICLLEDRFGELPVALERQVDQLGSLEDVAVYFSNLWEATSLGDIFN
ncbi:hypothetical protein [Vreelandella venusta]|uniref:hypothetical protein n=1 Tax=Vreelandella venusta TaxID=44935 RepID=UPI00384B6205